MNPKSLLVKPGRPIITRTYQLIGNINSHERKAIIKTCLGWIQNKFPEKIPDYAIQNIDSFIIDLKGQSVEGVSFLDHGLYALRLVHPDVPFEGKPAVPGRSWITDIAIDFNYEQPRIGIRILASSLFYSIGEINYTRPHLILDLVSKVGLICGKQLTEIPWLINDNDEFETLLELIKNPERTIPIIVISERVSEGRHDYAIKPESLSEKMLGIAHVVVLKDQYTFRLTEKWGKSWSVYKGAIRTYFGHFNIENDSFYSHPITFYENVKSYQYKDNSGELAFCNFIKDNLLKNASKVNLFDESIKFVMELKEEQSQVSRQELFRQAMALNDYPKIIEAYKKEHDALNQKIADLKNNNEMVLEEAANVDAENKFLKDENYKIKNYNSTMRYSIEQKENKNIDYSLDIPDSLSDMPTWIDNNFAGRLILLPRAQKGLGSVTNYAKITELYQALILLGRDYYNLRCGLIDQKAWQEAVERQHLHFSGSIEASRAGEQGEEYYVNFPPNTAKTRLLENHIRCNTNTKDPNRCLCIYFLWDDENNTVVIGWLPTHLTNRMS